MKVLPFKIPKSHKDTFYFQVDDGLIFFDKLHQHEEIQLSYIKEGGGTLIVGDTINRYQQGDVLIIGSQIPHVFKSDPQSTRSRMLSLYFTQNSFGTKFFQLDELTALEPFFTRAIQGFKITGNDKKLGTLFLNLEKTSQLNRFLILLQILDISATASYESLSAFVYEKKYSDSEGKRMRNVFEYTMNHFVENVSLDTIAEVANMTKNAFCKYFKKRTNKTYIQFLTELRMEHACKLLQTKNDLSIVQIAQASGFSNISNFNRQFKSALTMTPLAYRKKNR